MVCSNYFWNCSFSHLQNLTEIALVPFCTQKHDESSQNLQTHKTLEFGSWAFLSYLHQLRWEIHSNPSTKMAGHLQQKAMDLRSCQRVPSPHDFWNSVAELVLKLQRFFFGWILDESNMPCFVGGTWRHIARLLKTPKEIQEKQRIHQMSFTIYHNDS